MCGMRPEGLWPKSKSGRSRREDHRFTTKTPRKAEINGSSLVHLGSTALREGAKELN
jgi:hypothetical protein